MKGSNGATVKIALLEALPLATAIAAYGLSFGVLANQAGFHPGEATAMSVLVFSGSVQLAAAGMLIGGAGMVSVLITATLLNLRNLLYGAALSKGISTAGRWRWALSFWVSDEPFVLGSARFTKYGPDPLYFAVISFTFYIAWVFATLAGALIGGEIDPHQWGLDLAFPLTFTALLIPSLRKRPEITTALAAAILTTGMEFVFPDNPLTIIATGVAAPFAGLLMARRDRHVS
ncbi:branched-chain amino acid ABC transporter permease [Sediminibacillus dalangtanensis]|uniref:Branched-chain amino acid ABC transporter permease n=1 Tax=Sediminibacillus dalangtanensis TaxID=2729421 RepID=A0ABX7VWX3_9BACI|nr:AzlC family ABC transporter permease [Sediminibacillus dalangtanensis]QTM99101.1 branched-chain amino acid ABC transporter permease [Sediminibacillus dalangtanensis]